MLDAGIVRILDTERVELADDALATLSRDELTMLENDRLPDVEVVVTGGLDSRVLLRYRRRVPIVTTLPEKGGA